MKKALLYFLAFIFICFLLPALLTKRDKTVNVEGTKEIAENNQKEITRRRTK